MQGTNWHVSHPHTESFSLFQRQQGSPSSSPFVWPSSSVSVQPWSQYKRQKSKFTTFIAELLGPPELVAPPLRAEMIQVSLASRLRQQTRIACLRCRPRGLRSNAIYPCVSKASSARVAKAFNIQQLHHQPVNPLRSVRREEEVA